jgi:hypothetical protein
MSAAHHVHNRSGKQRDRERGYSIKNYHDEPAKKTVRLISNISRLEKRLAENGGWNHDPTNHHSQQKQGEIETVLQTIPDSETEQRQQQQNHNGNSEQQDIFTAHRKLSLHLATIRRHFAIQTCTEIADGIGAGQTSSGNHRRF